jgi:hypothetical protein
VLWNYIDQNKNMEGVNIQLKAVGEHRKWELEDMIDKITTALDLKNDLYEIDRLIRSNGHRVVRLPPYNWYLSLTNPQFTGRKQKLSY